MNSNYNYFFFDIFSKRLGFYYNNNEKIGSMFGLIFTALYIFISLAISFYHLILSFQRKEIKVFDATIYSQKMPAINLDSNNLYFAFGLEDPHTLNRYIDESIYYPQILYIEKIKINNEFKTIFEKNLDYERCKEENFGKNYQHLFIKGELNNSYCLKDFNYNLTFVGGFKYEKMNYIIIKIFPCKNSSENNNHCKPQEEIDNYLTSVYFSILVKDFGLNPLNHTFPVSPTIHDLYTTIDKRLYRNFILNFGITEVHTDAGLFLDKIKKEEYLQFRQTYQNFFFKDEKEDLNENELCIVQLRLEDTIVVQLRQYTKITEIFSKIGGYMQLIYTVFSLILLLINRFHSELKIINSIFKFNLKENKMGLKFKSLDLDSKNIFSSNKNLIFTSKRSLNKLDNDNSKNKLFKIENNKSIISSGLNISDNKRISDCQSNQIKFSKKNLNNLDDNKINTSKSYKNFPIINGFINDEEDKNDIIEFKDNISLNIFYYYFCRHKNKKIRNYIELYDLGYSFYRKRLDIVHVFSLLLITEKVFIKNYKNQIDTLYKENELLQTKRFKK